MSARPVILRACAVSALCVLLVGCGAPASAPDTSPTDASVAVDTAAPIDVAPEPDSSVNEAGSATDVTAPSDARAEDASAPTDVSAPTDASRPRLRDRYPLMARFPEGGTFDPSDDAFYVGSLGDGTVRRVDAITGEERVVFTETAPGRWWTLGMDIDVTRRRLWVCAMDDRSPAPRAGHVWVFDTTTGRRIANHALSTAAMDATCTDVAVTADGRAYVCDREQGRIYRAEVSAAPTVFVNSPALSARFIGQNAMLVLPDQSALLTVLYGPPSLVRVDLRDASVRAVTINGRFSDLTPLAGADGMTYANGSVYVAFTSKLIRVTPTLADWSRADSTNVDLPNGLTDVISTRDGLFVLNGQAVRFALGTTPDPFALVRFVGTL
jgi:sugar lactone lactonase YvrE